MALQTIVSVICCTGRSTEDRQGSRKYSHGGEMLTCTTTYDSVFSDSRYDAG